MHNIFEKLHTYDIVVYLIPGIFTICYICYGIHLMHFMPQNRVNNLITDTVAFFVISYYVGIIIHEASYLLQEFELNRLWDKLYSKKLLHKNCSILSPEDRQKGWHIIKNDFGIKVDLRFKNYEELNKKIDDYSQSLYERCRESLKYKYKNNRKLDQAEIFNIHYGLARNLLASTLIALIYFCIVAVYIYIKQLPFFALAISLMGLLYIFSKLLYQRAEKYAKHHVSHAIIMYLSIFHNKLLGED